MRRNNTSNSSTFVRPGQATFLYPDPPGSTPWTTVRMPPGSTETTSLHWHETHDEYIEVLQGMALITRDYNTSTFIPSDGITFIPRYMRHELQRATPKNTSDPRVKDYEDTELVMRERTNPQDGEKEVAFRNMFGVMGDESLLPGVLGKVWMFWGVLVVMAGTDGWPVFFSAPKFLGKYGRALESVVTHSMLGLAAGLGRMVGLRTIYEEYTPSVLFKKVGDKKE